MKFLIVVAIFAAGCSAALSYARVLSTTSALPHILFAVALILILLQMVNTNDRRY